MREIKNELSYNFESDYDWNFHMAVHGWILLASRSRNKSDNDRIKQTIESVFNFKIDTDDLFNIFSLKKTPLSPFIGLINRVCKIDEFNFIWNYEAMKTLILCTVGFYFSVIITIFIENCL